MYTILIIILIILLFIIHNLNSIGAFEKRSDDEREFKQEIKKFNSEIDLQFKEQTQIINKQIDIILSEAEVLLKSRLLNSQKRYLEIIEICDTFLIANQTNYNILLNKAEALSNYAQEINSLAHIEQSLIILNDLTIHNNKVELYLLLGDTLLDKCFMIKSQSEKNDEFFNCGKLACSFYYKAYEIDKNKGASLADFAYAKSIIGDIYAASYFIKKAKEISPNGTRVLEIERYLRGE